MREIMRRYDYIAPQSLSVEEFEIAAATLPAKSLVVLQRFPDTSEEKQRLARIHREIQVGYYQNGSVYATLGDEFSVPSLPLKSDGILLQALSHTHPPTRMESITQYLKEKVRDAGVRITHHTMQIAEALVEVTPSKEDLMMTEAAGIPLSIWSLWGETQYTPFSQQALQNWQIYPPNSGLQLLSRQ